MPVQPTCPYCAAELAKTPKRKSKCPKCKRDIYVRSSPVVFSRSLLTEQEAITVDFLLSLRDGYGVRIDGFWEVYKQLTAKLGRKPYATEVAWHMARSEVNQREECGGIYYLMALFLNQLGEDYVPALRKHHEATLLGYKQESDVIKGVAVLAALNSCAACMEMNNKQFSVDEALRLMPIPCPNCTHPVYNLNHGFCRCTYIPVTRGWNELI
jgi:hypothetical protein